MKRFINNIKEDLEDGKYSDLAYSIVKSDASEAELYIKGYRVPIAKIFIKDMSYVKADGYAITISAQDDLSKIFILKKHFQSYSIKYGNNSRSITVKMNGGEEIVIGSPLF